jgi:PAS domain S-box-containing protein
MDWSSIAALVAERGTLPIGVLDPSGRICLVSAEFERILGWSRHEIVGRPWVDIVVPSESRRAAALFVEEALRGALQNHRCEMMTRDGQRLTVDLEVAAIGRGTDEGLVLIVTKAIPSVAPDSVRDLEDYEYEVMITDDDDRHTLLNLNAGDAMVPAFSGRQKCHEILHGAPQPCAWCPLRKGGDNPSTRASGDAGPSDAAPSQAGPSKRWVLTSVHPATETHARLVVRTVSDQAVRALNRARLSALATNAGLSDREREVLSALTEGQQVDDIAQTLGLSARTVKYHQQSLLGKLGADSRHDLLRLLF